MPVEDAAVVEHEVPLRSHLISRTHDRLLIMADPVSNPIAGFHDSQVAELLTALADDLELEDPYASYCLGKASNIIVDKMKRDLSR